MTPKEQKTFAYIFAIGGGAKVVWSGDDLSVLLDKRVPSEERDKLSEWLDAAEPGWIYTTDREDGLIVCTGVKS